MKLRGRTRPFRTPSGEIVPGSIAEIGYWRLGGVDQWVMVRGVNRNNPLLVMLHGGPGFSETGLFRHFNGPLEEHFTVVYWDQRGACKSFDRTINPATMTVDQFIGDLDELVTLACKRVGRGQVAIFGHSWGSALGVLYAARFPNKVAAYVGSGQLGDWPAAEAASYAYALAEAERQANAKAIQDLNAIGPPPYSAAALWIERTWLQRFEGNLRLPMLWKMGRILLSGPELSMLDLPNLYRGFRWSIEVMWDEVSKIRLPSAAPVLEVPVFFLLGRKDRWVPPETSVAYLDALTAPRKELVWFEESGHEPFADEADKFNRTMVELVRPAVA
jgi:pimeloyl-ACP methyl ester carboxylesterase